MHKRLKLTLELVKKEMEISKIQVRDSGQLFHFRILHSLIFDIFLTRFIGCIQESIAKAIEEKISGEQRRYLLNEQLKAIKKVI